jgi:hypothetical protein
MSSGTERVSADFLDRAVGRGLAFLRRSQLPSGEFKVFMSTDHALGRDCVADSSPFPTALVAYSLGFAGRAGAGDMLDRAVRFLLAEMEGPGLWRYWTKGHRYHSAIPPDLDDTACVSYVLRRHGARFPDNTRLVLANRDRAGLFYTWVTPRWPMPRVAAFWRASLRQWLSPLKLHYFWRLNESEPSDVDCVVNANVLFYLGDGEWARAVLYYGGPKRYYGWGSEELTTGFCLEALLRYRAAEAEG